MTSQYVKTDFVSQVYIRTKIHDQIKNAIGAKTRSLWECLRFFLLHKRFAVAGKPGEMWLGSFCNKSAENSFFVYILIARSGYYSQNEL